jgi:hypothetical protein
MASPLNLGFPTKIAAVTELTRMCGWAQPDRIELSATDTLAEFINCIREAPRRPGMTDYAEANGERGLESAATGRVRARICC